jgi:putative transposase
MTSISTTPLRPQSEIETAVRLFDDWFDPIEANLRDRAREFLQAMFEAELEETLARSRYARRVKPSSDDSEAAPAVTGHRHSARAGCRGHVARPLARPVGRPFIPPPPGHR